LKVSVDRLLFHLRVGKFDQHSVGSDFDACLHGDLLDPTFSRRRNLADQLRDKGADAAHFASHIAALDRVDYSGRPVERWHRWLELGKTVGDATDSNQANENYYGALETLFDFGFRGTLYVYHFLLTGSGWQLAATSNNQLSGELHKASLRERRTCAGSVLGYF